MAEHDAAQLRLRFPVDLSRDHVRGGEAPDRVSMVIYADYLCPYCRGLRPVLVRLREVLGERFQYVYRHFPNERAHPGATMLARLVEAGANQGKFWELHDWAYAQPGPPSKHAAYEFAESLGLDMAQFRADLESEETRARVEEDVAQGRRNGVSGPPTVFIDGQRYDDSWEFHALLEALERPLAARVRRSARAFASLPASGGFVLIIAAVAALVFANSPLAPWYHAFVDAEFIIGPAGHALALTVGEWASEGLLAVFFLLVGLEIRRELSVGSLSDRRNAVLPVVGAVGGVVMPALVYLLVNRGPTSPGWSVPTATDVAFTLGILALLGNRIPAAVRVSIAALAVVDDVASVITLAVFYAHGFALAWFVAAVGVSIALLALNRWRVYRAWPYAVLTIALGLCLHSAGIHAALCGVVLAMLLPSRPAPAAGPLLAQTANALTFLQEAERASSAEEGDEANPEQVWEWASRNLSAAADRLLSSAERIERAVAPWTAYLILPFFAFAATGIELGGDVLAAPTRPILLGVVLGLVVGKPLGIFFAGWLAVKVGIAAAPPGVSLRTIVGAACLCGVGYTMSLLMAEQALPDAGEAAVAKVGVLVGSTLAAAVGTAVLLSTGALTDDRRSTQSTSGSGRGDTAPPQPHTSVGVV